MTPPTRDPDAPAVPPLAAWLSRVARRSRPPSPASALDRIRRGPVERVLAIKVHDQLGDFLVATPAIAALRARWPRATLVLVTREYLAPLARRNRTIDRVMVMPRGVAGLLSACARVAALRPDLAVVLNSVSRSRTADALAAASRAAVVVGRARAVGGPLPADAPDDPLTAALARRDPVYDLDVPAARGHEHFVERALDLVRGFAPSTGERLVLDLDDRERAAGRAALAAAAAEAGIDSAPHEQRPWIGLHPGAANPLKCWPLESFATLGAALVAGGARLIVVDTPREPGRASELIARLAAHGTRAARLPSPTVDAFVQACAGLDLLVCNDSGPMHMAAALGVPTLSFHSLGPPGEWAPRGPRAIALHARPIEAIGVDEAVGAAERLLPR